MPGIFFGVKARPAYKIDNLAVIYEPIVHKMWVPPRLKNLEASTAYGDNITVV
jgi:hypothetical protein